MQPGELKQEQKDIVWRYAHCAGLWRRKQSRNFATLESDMTAGYETVADGITVGARSGCPILGDAKDPAFFAAIFREDNAATPDMRALDLERLRRFIIDGDLVALGIHHDRQRECDFAVHGDPPLRDHLFHMTPRSHATSDATARGSV